ncbi:MAG: hypothetical protein EOP09_18585 [Proteobacteria bacterium]|nr:MAG: hypothetical protein EOP09_18585 [Pseudomonadota bacterium]
MAKPQSYCPNSPDLAKPSVADRQEKAAANQGEKQSHMVMVSIPREEEEKKLCEGRGPGDLPPTNSKDQDVLAWMNGFLPKGIMEKHESPRENCKVVNFEAFKNKGRIDEAKEPKAKVFKTLREARTAVRRDVEPIARFERAIVRVQDRASIEEVMAVLWREHKRLCATKDRCERYTPPEGKFKRLCKAWSYFGPTFRTEFFDA